MYIFLYNFFGLIVVVVNSLFNFSSLFIIIDKLYHLFLFLFSIEFLKSQILEFGMMYEKGEINNKMAISIK